MFLEDYHLHSKYSFDSSMDLGEISLEAEKKGIREIAITDHVELAADCIHDEKKSGNESAEEIEKLQEQWGCRMTIRKGMELGNAQIERKEAIRIAHGFQGDVILGSVHNLVRNEDVGYYDYRNLDKEDFCKTYLNAVYDLALHVDFDILAHITYPLKAIYSQTKWKGNIHPFRGQLERIFEVLIKRKKGIEVNTSGLRVPLHRLLPDQEILKLYRECGGTIITIGSDAHEKRDVAEGIREGMACLRNLGYTEITTFCHRTPSQHGIEEKR